MKPAVLCLVHGHTLQEGLTPPSLHRWSKTAQGAFCGLHVGTPVVEQHDVAQCI